MGEWGRSVPVGQAGKGEKRCADTEAIGWMVHMCVAATAQLCVAPVLRKLVMQYAKGWHGCLRPAGLPCARLTTHTQWRVRHGRAAQPSRRVRADTPVIRKARGGWEARARTAAPPLALIPQIAA